MNNCVFCSRKSDEYKKRKSFAILPQTRTLTPTNFLSCGSQGEHNIASLFCPVFIEKHSMVAFNFVWKLKCLQRRDFFRNKWRKREPWEVVCLCSSGNGNKGSCRSCEFFPVLISGVDSPYNSFLFNRHRTTKS